MDIRLNYLAHKEMYGRQLGELASWTRSPITITKHIMDISGPSRDAATGEVIWRHRALDADGICSPGTSVNLHCHVVWFMVQ